MSKAHQFLSLVRFHAGINPAIWIMPLALASPIYLNYVFYASVHPNLNSLLNLQNLFFVGFIGVWVLAPEMAQMGSARNSSLHSGTEFLLTRAIDRPSIYRSRAVCLYLFVLIIPALALSLTLRKPGLMVTEYSKTAREECLHSVPGSALKPDPSGSTSPLIFLRRGNVLIDEWYIWLIAAAAFAVQVLLQFLAPLKHRTLIFYVVFMTLIFTPLLADLRHIKQETPTASETVFFVFAGHQLLFWAITAAILILGQLVCERRFARSEQ